MVVGAYASIDGGDNAPVVAIRPFCRIYHAIVWSKSSRVWSEQSIV
jgi:hypothetical protein